MALLNSLKSDVLNDTVVKILKRNNVFNTIDFLQEDSARLTNITKLSGDEVSIICREICNKYGAPSFSGTERHDRILLSFAILPTGIAKLDEILQGGLHCGKITEICGLPDSGKTQLALSIASNISSDLKQNVLYIDTKRDFSATRMHEILKSKAGDENDIGLDLERIKVVPLFSLNHLILFLHDLQGNANVMKSIRLVIVDSLPAVMLQFQGEKTKESLGLLNHFVNIVRLIGCEFNIPFIVINLLTRWVEATSNEIDGVSVTSHSVETKATLGKYWKHIPYTSIHIEKSINDIQTIEISVQSCVSPNTNYLTVNISSKGVT